MTQRIGDIFPKLSVSAVRLAERFAAGETHRIVVGRQPVADRHAVIEGIALPLPAAGLGRHLFQILQSAAFEVVHFAEPFLQENCRGFFAADAAGAEYGDFWVTDRVEMLPGIRCEVAELLYFRTERALEASHSRFLTDAPGAKKQHAAEAESREFLFQAGTQGRWIVQGQKAAKRSNRVSHAVVYLSASVAPEQSLS